jgi:hypothetical protein
MKNYFRRYLILAVTGAVIIGLAFYLLLNNYIDREKILVAAGHIEAGTEIKSGDLEYSEYYKNSLPEEYLSNPEGLLGKTINIERRKGDYISADMFEEEDKSTDVFSGLDSGDAVIAVEIRHPEPLLDELKSGDIVTIISTVRDKDFIVSDLHKKTPDIEDAIVGDNYNGNTYLSSDYIAINTFNLSKNIVSIDGQIIIRNLKIVNLQKDIIEAGNSILINNKIDSIELYLQCELEEAPIIARLTADNKYKIIFEKL